ncbi:hypothetical protein L9F63_025562, partial [Diploptera punctata]
MSSAKIFRDLLNLICFQYLDMRFKSRLVRVIRSLLNLGVTVLTPCVAAADWDWSALLGIHPRPSPSSSVVFKVMGGLKAAITADVVQGLTMIASCLAIIIKGCIDVGGVDEVITISKERGRLDFFNFDLDPTIRVATVSAFFGQLFMSLSIFGCQQNFVQRYCSMSSQREVTKTMLANIPVITVLFSLSWVVGMVIFANYANCDPLSLGYINKIDEILPFYMEDQFMFIPGILGLFMASLFNGALSLAVSNLNSLATVTWEDFISQIPACRDFTDKKQLLSIKIIGCLYGFIIMGISFGVATLSGVIESSMLMTSATSGPLLGVFLLAMLFPCCNWKPYIVTLWITFGSLTIEKEPIELLPLSTSGCTNDSYSPFVMKMLYCKMTLYNYDIFDNSTEDAVPIMSQPELIFSPNYSITYMYYSLFGCFITVFLGVVISLLCDAYDEKLIHPLALKISLLFPGRPRKYVEDKCSGKKCNGINCEILQAREEQKPCDFSKEPSKLHMKPSIMEATELPHSTFSSCLKKTNARFSNKNSISQRILPPD